MFRLTDPQVKPTHWRIQGGGSRPWNEVVVVVLNKSTLHLATYLKFHVIILGASSYALLASACIVYSLGYLARMLQFWQASQSSLLSELKEWQYFAKRRLSNLDLAGNLLECANLLTSKFFWMYAQSYFCRSWAFILRLATKHSYLRSRIFNPFTPKRAHKRGQGVRLFVPLVTSAV